MVRQDLPATKKETYTHHKCASAVDVKHTLKRVRENEKQEKKIKSKKLTGLFKVMKMNWQMVYTMKKESWQMLYEILD